MRAVVYESYGPPDVLKIREIEKPECPEDGVLVRVHASSVNIAEWYGMTGLFLARIGRWIPERYGTALKEMP